jgi:hypothetical protein
MTGCLAARSLLEGKTGVKPISRFDASQFPTTFAAQIEDFDNEGCVRPPMLAASKHPASTPKAA